MKILALTPYYLPTMGGIEVFVDQLARALRPLGIETAVLTDLSGPEPTISTVNGTPVYRYALSSSLRGRNPAAPLKLIGEVGRVTEFERPDIIHLHSATQASAFFLDRVLPKLTFAPKLVVTQHGVLTAEDRLGVSRKLLMNCDVLTGVTNAVLQSAIEFSGRAGRCEMIFNAVEPPVNTAGPRMMPEQHRLLCVGRMQLEKGFDLAIEALADLRSRGIDAELRLVGGGENRSQFEALVDEHGLADRVRFLGVLGQFATRSEMAAASLLLVPSRSREGFGLVAAEAAFAGTPVVASRLGGLPEVVEDGLTGRLVAVDNAHDLADAVADLLQDAEVWKKFSANASRRASEKFDVDRCVGQYAELYRSLIQ